MKLAYCDGGTIGLNGRGATGGYGSWKCGAETRRLEHAYATNNESEYATLIDLLGYVCARGLEDVVIYCDSQLIVRQVNGEWKVKAGNLRGFCKHAQELMRDSRARLEWVPRETIVRQLGH